MKVKLYKSVKDFPRQMATFAELEPKAQTTSRLGRVVNWSSPTLTRRFGDEPVGGAYVMAACVIMAPARQALRWFLRNADIGFDRRSLTRVGLRGAAYAILSEVLANPAVMAGAHTYGSRGVRLRSADLHVLALRYAEHPDDGDPWGLDETPRALTRVDYIPTLVDAVGHVLTSLNLPTRRATEVARYLVAIGLENPGTNALGVTNKFMDWVVPTFRLGSALPPVVEQAWLATRLSESTALDGAELELQDLFRLLVAAAR